jgi:CTP synthase (UTP-ammonia lyase)
MVNKESGSMARTAQPSSRNVEVLLVHDVEKLGARGEIVKVKPGYARNFLLPQGKATPATQQNKRMVEKHKEKLAAIEVGRVKQYQRIADAVSKYSATIEAHATSDNHCTVRLSLVTSAKLSSPPVIRLRPNTFASTVRSRNWACTP